MIRNIFPPFLKKAISTNYPTVCATVTMMDIEEVTSDLTGNHATLSIEDWLSITEREKLHSFKMQKRKSEWLAGRACAKTAAADFLVLQKQKPQNLDQILISNMASGRPYISWSEKAHQLKSICDISISHSNKYALALIADTACGIDIQEPKQTLHRVKERFCLDTEETRLKKHFPEEDELGSLTLLWAAKEAIRKTYSVHFVPEFVQLKISDIANSTDSWWRITFSHTDITPTVICGFFHGYGIAICFSQGLSYA